MKDHREQTSMLPFKVQPKAFKDYQALSRAFKVLQVPAVGLLQALDVFCGSTVDPAETGPTVGVPEGEREKQNHEEPFNSRLSVVLLLIWSNQGFILPKGILTPARERR
ncbi:hypothetical protein INR49_015787 [Caranx melampygus]|nr:hypothetical protein INR49_015787 [Caranx melampygus]